MKARHLTNTPIVGGGNHPLDLLTAPAVLRVLLRDTEQEEEQLFDYVTGAGYR